MSKRAERLDLTQCHHSLINTCPLIAQSQVIVYVMPGFFFGRREKKLKRKKLKVWKNSSKTAEKTQGKSLKTGLSANSELPLEIKELQLLLLLLFSGKNPRIWTPSAQNSLKNSRNTPNIEQFLKNSSNFTPKTQQFFKKTQGNLPKTQLSANSELVRAAEFCPKKKPDIGSIFVSNWNFPRPAVADDDDCMTEIITPVVVPAAAVKQPAPVVMPTPAAPPQPKKKFFTSKKRKMEPSTGVEEVADQPITEAPKVPPLKLRIKTVLPPPPPPGTIFWQIVQEHIYTH